MQHTTPEAGSDGHRLVTELNSGWDVPQVGEPGGRAETVHGSASVGKAVDHRTRCMTKETMTSELRINTWLDGDAWIVSLDFEDDTGGADITDTLAVVATQREADALADIYRTRAQSLGADGLRVTAQLLICTVPRLRRALQPDDGGTSSSRTDAGRAVSAQSRLDAMADAETLRSMEDMMTITIRVLEIPSHSKGWMAYKVAAVSDNLQYGTTTMASADGTVALDIIGAVDRATRRERIREHHDLTLVAGETREIRRAVSASNRYILSVSAS